jgi:multidrug efflux pump
MSLSSPFIHRPVATTLLTIAIAIAGAIGYVVLPVSPLPQVDFPTIDVQSSLSGASANIMASSIATPLERQLGHIAGVTEMTSSSSLGSTHITIQFDLSGHQCSTCLPAGKSAGEPHVSQGKPGGRTHHDSWPYLEQV